MDAVEYLLYDDFVSEVLAMVRVIYRDGRRVDFPFASEPPEYRLALACYNDDLARVREVLEAHPLIDPNAAVLHSKSRGNGTPLVLTGSEEIARLLIEKGADVNHCYYNGRDFISPLDSAEKELTKLPVRTDPAKAKRVRALIRYLESVGGTRSCGGAVCSTRTRWQVD